MPLTVADLLELPGLGLNAVAGRSGLDRPIRWVHASELPDPTRWLSGGELLLTTGIGMKGSPNHQRAYLKRLARAGLAGLGLGVGLGFDAAPPSILRAADREGFPVLEVPYQVPFIAIGEAVSSALARDRMRELEMSEEIHDRLTRLVTLGSGATEILEEVVRMAPGWVYLFSRKGEVVGRAVSDAVDAPDAAAVWSKLPAGFAAEAGGRSSALLDPAGAVLALGVVSTKGTDGIVVFGRPGRLEVRDRLVVRHAVTVLGLLLASRRAVAEVERTLAAETLIEALEGSLTGAPLMRRLGLAGFPPAAELTVMIAEPADPAADVEPLAAVLEDRLGEGAERACVAVVEGRVVAVVVHPDPVGLARRALERWPEQGPDLEGARIGVGGAVAPAALRDSFQAAALALRAAPESTRVATGDDLGAYRLLLGSQSRAVLESFVGSVLGPLMERDAERGSDLVASVRAFVEAGGRWEEGAQALGVHRHTLRYRVNQAQELLSRDLFDPEDRMEIWLACKAADTLP
ncbi:MAG: PucR family transcriptional regulator [Actinomycetota bacterium]